jgi:hypothetical protein
LKATAVFLAKSRPWLFSQIGREDAGNCFPGAEQDAKLGLIKLGDCIVVGLPGRIEFILACQNI